MAVELKFVRTMEGTEIILTEPVLQCLLAPQLQLVRPRLMEISGQRETWVILTMEVLPTVLGICVLKMMDQEM
jgi:hypothetical protein